MVDETKETTQEHFPGISIESELKKSYMDYAMSVIVGRIGKYHPHGDTAAYDTIVRMAQNFSMRYLLVDGQGNFGSVDGDSPAAMRYTEARMTKIDQEIIADLEKETVDFAPTYDNSSMEPVVFPTKIPTLLVNGSSGIAVGMATNIPPHNITEVIKGLIALIDEPNITVNQLMEHITGPDFPTGAFICGRAGIREAYETGRGSILMRSRTHIEKSKKANRESIIITEIPYQQNKASLIEKIAILIKDKKIDSISEVRDESDRRGMRIVLELKKDEIADVVLNQLYKMTPLQKSFGVIFLSIVNGRPEVLNLRQILLHFLLHRKTIVYRRTAYDLKKTEEKAHILEGLKIAITNLDAVVELIKKSPGPKEAKEKLVKKYKLSAIQAQAILDMRLQRLTGLERDKIIAEYEELMKEISRFKEILGDENLVMKIIRDEFEEIIEKYGDERRTEIIEAPDEILPEDMIAQEEMVVTVTHEGYIKRNQVDLYRAQRRGGKGVKGIKTHEEDFVNSLYLAITHDTFLFFTNKGKVFHRRVFEIPQASRIARGKALVNLLDLSPEEHVAAIMPVKSFELEEGEERYVMMVTRNGVVKKTHLKEFARSMKRGKIALTIREGDEIISAVMTNGKNDIMLFSSNGMSNRFNESNVRPMGRTAAGVKGMTLNPGDTVVGVVVVDDTTESILSVTENGFGKRTSVEDYPVRNRGGKGVFTIKTSERNGKAIGALQVIDDDEIMMITDGGKIIRTNMRNVRVIGRNTQGVNLFNLAKGEKVVAMDRVAEPSESDNGEEDNTEE
jgi:DNA gyrase subunit A